MDLFKQLLKTGPDKKEKEAESAAAVTGEPGKPSPETQEPDAGKVFEFFGEICGIPHGSGYTKEISDYLVKFAQERGLEYRQDDADNVVIKCPASPGCENAPTIILQGHMDMVLEKADDKEIDLITEPITVLQEGDWLTADGTTLGGDDGIAVAMMMAVLDDRTIVHPPLECIFTSDEEVGMLGAAALDLSDIKGRIMLNLDSEQEGMITAGCAGGARLVQRLKFKRRARAGRLLNIRVAGLRGGHSGEDIRFGRANAILVLARILYNLREQAEFRIINLHGGTVDNAIPREASAQILLPLLSAKAETALQEGAEEDVWTDQAIAALERAAQAVKAEFELPDPGMEITWDLEEEPLEAYAFTGKGTGKCLQYLMSVPDGIQVYSPSFKNRPQTSLNLGVLRSDEGGIEAVFLIRSSLENQKKMLIDRLHSIADAFGGKSRVTGTYPAWEYRVKSPFRERVISIYEREYGGPPVVTVIHGGVECGILSAGLPGLDVVSMGPDMEAIHTPGEKLSISSSKRLWKFVLALLKDLTADAAV